MANRIFQLRYIVSAFAAAALAVTLFMPAGFASAAATVGGSPLVSTWELTSGGSEGRDCGYSSPMAGSDLWVFCDTALYSSSGKLAGFISGSTAAKASYSAGGVPGTLTDLPSGTDTQFIISPTGLATPSGTACSSANGAYPASWPSGETTIPNTKEVFVTFNNYCVTSSAMTLEGNGVATYTSGAKLPVVGKTVFSSVPPAASIVSAANLGSPIISGSYVYLYASNCTSSVYATCLQGNVWLARVPLADYTVAKDYRWLGASNIWQTSAANAVNIIPGVTPLAINVAMTSHGVTVLSENNLAAGYTLWTSSSFGSGFTALTTGQVGCTNTTSGAGGLCRAMNLHPELSNGSELTLSYFNPSVGPAGHVVTTQVPW